MEKRPIIIDTDPGVDDAAAIMMLQASGRFDIKGMTAVHGNVPLEHTAPNALFLSELYGIGCPVAVGANEAMIVSMPKADNVHGVNGLGGFVYRTPKRGFYHKRAWEFIYETAAACGGELELFAIGPLTNIAIAVLKYPVLRDLIKNVVIMGGAAHAGNVSPYAEFNIRQDPHAASVVLDFGFKNLTVVDLDCCYSGYLTDQEADRMLIIKSRIGPLFESMRLYKRRYQKEMSRRYPAAEEFSKDRNIYCDAVAAAILAEPDIAGTSRSRVFCETQSALNLGQTVIDRNGRFSGKPNASLAVSVDRERFVNMFFDAVDYYNEERTVRFGG